MLAWYNIVKWVPSGNGLSDSGVGLTLTGSLWCQLLQAKVACQDDNQLCWLDLEGAPRRDRATGRVKNPLLSIWNLPSVPMEFPDEY